jgi:hypothetical protein
VLSLHNDDRRAFQLLQRCLQARHKSGFLGMRPSRSLVQLAPTAGGLDAAGSLTAPATAPITTCVSAASSSSSSLVTATSQLLPPAPAPSTHVQAPAQVLQAAVSPPLPPVTSGSSSSSLSSPPLPPLAGGGGARPSASAAMVLGASSPVLVSLPVPQSVPVSAASATSPLASATSTAAWASARVVGTTSPAAYAPPAGLTALALPEPRRVPFGPRRTSAPSMEELASGPIELDDPLSPSSQGVRPPPLSPNSMASSSSSASQSRDVSPQNARMHSVGIASSSRDAPSSSARVSSVSGEITFGTSATSAVSGGDRALALSASPSRGPFSLATSPTAASARRRSADATLDLSRVPDLGSVTRRASTGALGPRAGARVSPGDGAAGSGGGSAGGRPHRVARGSATARSPPVAPLTARPRGTPSPSGGSYNSAASARGVSLVQFLQANADLLPDRVRQQMGIGAASTPPPPPPASASTRPRTRATSHSPPTLGPVRGASSPTLLAGGAGGSGSTRQPHAAPTKAHVLGVPPSSGALGALLHAAGTGTGTGTGGGGGGAGGERRTAAGSSARRARASSSGPSLRLFT